MNTERLKKILIVDDDAISAMSGKASLEKCGYSVITAYNGTAAIEAVAHIPGIDLIMMDIELGDGIDGTQTAALILENHDLPVVFMSSHIESEIVEKTASITSYGYFVKNSHITIIDATIKMAFRLFESDRMLRRSNEALRHHSQLLENIIENFPGFVLWKDPHSVFLGCNSNFARKCGISSPAEIIGKSDFDLPFHNSEVETFLADDRIVMQTKKAKLHFEEREHVAHDEEIFLDTCKIPLFDADGQVSGILAVAMDITELKKNEIEIKTKNDELKAANDFLLLKETALLQSESRYRTLVDLAVDGILLGSHEGVITDANEYMCSLVGMKREEFIGKHINFLSFSPESLVKSPWRFDLLQKGITVLSDRVLIRSDGTEIAVEMRTKMMPDGTYQSIYRDVSERKKAAEEKAKLEAQLQQAQKLESVGRLAGGVAHDFNNMLGVILGHTELAMIKPGLAEDLFDRLQEINKAAERSADLTRQLLAYARNQAVAPKVLNLNETVSGMINMLERLIGEDIELVLKPAHDLWMVKIDPSQIDQIMANLCINARDAIVDVGKIIIETGNVTFDKNNSAVHGPIIPGEYVRIAVSDDGCGMDKDTLDHIFEPFFTTKEMGKGTGLGLATVYGAVKQNNGFINVYSEPELGTTFSIYLPRNSGEEQDIADKASAPAMRGSETILLVEDESAILHVTKKMLEVQGYSVLPASSPAEAITRAHDHPGEINLLITDVVMPEMNGRDLAKKMSSVYPHIKLLFMSGYMANIIARNGMLDDGVFFIQKPFSIKELADKVRDVLDH